MANHIIYQKQPQCYHIVRPNLILYNTFGVYIVPQSISGINRFTVTACFHSLPIHLHSSHTVCMFRRSVAARATPSITAGPFMWQMLIPEPLCDGGRSLNPPLDGKMLQCVSLC